MLIDSILMVYNLYSNILHLGFDKTAVREINGLE